MAFLLTFSTKASKSQKQPSKSRTKPHRQQQSPWERIKHFLNCKQIQRSIFHVPLKNSCIGSFRDVFVDGSKRVVHIADYSPESSSLDQENGLLGSKTVDRFSSSSRSLIRAVRSDVGETYTSSLRRMEVRKLSGSYECHRNVDTGRYLCPRSTICASPQCREAFQKLENLELHQAVSHAGIVHFSELYIYFMKSSIKYSHNEDMSVSEMGPEHSGRSIVEIIFKSSWLKKDNPFCKIERILKVHNTPRTIKQFVECQDAAKISENTTTKKNPRCAADGNEVLRFHCTTLSCSLGAQGSTRLCDSIHGCGACNIIRQGFKGNKPGGGGGGDGKGVLTTVSSSRAHDCMGGTETRRAMLVCRVIAGRVRRIPDEVAPEEDNMMEVTYDSVVRFSGIYSSLEELYVFNPSAILPCFIIVYKTLES